MLHSPTMGAISLWKGSSSNHRPKAKAKGFATLCSKTCYGLCLQLLHFQSAHFPRACEYGSFRRTLYPVRSQLRRVNTMCLKPISFHHRQCCVRKCGLVAKFKIRGPLNMTDRSKEMLQKVFVYQCISSTKSCDTCVLVSEYIIWYWMVIHRSIFGSALIALSSLIISIELNILALSNLLLLHLGNIITG